MTVDAGNSVKTIADLKREITDLKKALDQEVIGSEEAKKASNDLANAQNLLKQAIKGNTDVVNNATGSYNELNKKCEQLKLTYKSMADGIEKKNIAKQIAKLQEELKKQDAAIGDFKRNVGDYANSFTSAMGQMGVGTNGVTSAVGGLGKAFNVISKHPILAAIAGLLLIIKGLVSAFKKNEDAVNKLKVAFGPFEGLLNAVNTALGKLVNWIGDKLVKAFSAAASAAQSFIGWLQRMAEKMGMDKLAADLAAVNKRMEEGAEISAEEVKLLQQERDTRRQNAEAQRDIAKLQKEYKQAAGDTAKQAKIAKQIEEESQKVRQRNYDLAKAQYDLEKKKADQAPNSREDNEKLLAAEEKMLQAEAALYEVSKEQTKVWRQEAAEISANTKELEKNLEKRKALVDELNIWAESQEDIITKITREYEDAIKLLEDENGNIVDLNAFDLLTKRYLQRIEKAYEMISKAKAQKVMSGVGDTSVEENLENADYYNKKGERLRNEEQFTLEEHLKIEDEEYQHQKRLDEIRMRGLLEQQDTLKCLIENQEEFSKLSQEDQDKYIQQLAQTNSQITLLDAKMTYDAEKESKKRQKITEKEKKMRLAASLEIAGGIADIFGSIADAMDENNKEQFEASKAFSIASATIQMLVGIATALSGVMTTKSGPWDIALAAIQAATIAASGGATIAQIAKQQYKGDSNSAASAAMTSINAASGAVAAVNAPVQYTTAVEGASINDNIGDQRVYVTETDIADTTKKVNVQEAENRY